MSPAAPAPARTWPAAAAPLALAGAAAVALVVWGASPAARFMVHRPSAHPGTVATLPLFIVSWVLMAAAMMLPTTVPVLRAFRQVAGARPSAGRLAGLVIAGFLGVWALSGVAVGLFDAGVHALLHRGPGPSGAAPVLAATLAGAGLYQLSGAADRCATRCRSTFGLLHRHWTGGPAVARQSLAIGADHGLSCLGCCAPVMVTMLAAGIGNPAWMAGLGVLGAVHKHARWGRVLSVPIGVTLLAAGAAVAAAPVLAID